MNIAVVDLTTEERVLVARAHERMRATLDTIADIRGIRGVASLTPDGRQLIFQVAEAKGGPDAK